MAKRISPHLGGGMFGNAKSDEPVLSINVPVFFPLKVEEIVGPVPNPGNLTSMVQTLGLEARHRKYSCGICGHTTTGRVLAELDRTDGSHVQWCLCSCDRAEATILIDQGGEVLSQQPLAREFHAKSDWPSGISQLYEEAAKSLAAGAHTATAMLCRKVLMVCACEKGKGTVEDGKTFAFYVDYITNSVLTYPDAKKAIDAIRNIGNDATHEAQMVSSEDASRAMKIVTYMLNTIYSLPMV